MVLERKQPGLRRRRKPLRRVAKKPKPLKPPARAPTDLERAFATLEIDPTRELALVRAAYRRLVARCHPDKWAALGAGPRRAAEAHTREIIRAYELVAAVLAES